MTSVVFGALMAAMYAWIAYADPVCAIMYAAGVLCGFWQSILVVLEQDKWIAKYRSEADREQ